MTTNTNPTTSSTARHSLDLWLTMWNTDGDIARQICADDFRIHFAMAEPDGSAPADAIRTAEDFARYLGWWHEQNPGVVFTSVADAIDGDHGRLLWDMEADGRARVASTCSTSPGTAGSGGSGRSADSGACGADGTACDGRDRSARLEA